MSLTTSPLRIERVGKHYQNRWVLRNLSLSFEFGQIALLAGSNGAGKTTLLGILSTLLVPDQGSLFYEGSPLRENFLSDYRKKLGIVSYHSGCYLHLSALENLLLFGSLYFMNRKETSRRAETWLNQVGLADVMHRPVKTFSRGMLQRLALAKAMLPSPKILLLDEPYTGLDAGGKQLMTHFLRESKSNNVMIILASHEVADIAPFCDQVFLLDRGQLARQAKFTGTSCSIEAIDQLSQTVVSPSKMPAEREVAG